MFEENAQSKVEGFLKITDAKTGEVILEKKNAIHFENMSLAIAESLGHKSGGPLYKMAFGNGGSTVSGIGVVTYLTPNTIGASASLYNQTYEKIIDNNSVQNLDPTRNRIDISHVTGNLFSDTIISCILDTGEPTGQDSFDNTINVEAPFVFDEIGLVNYDGLLVTHVIFSPVQKSLNRVFNISYTIRIQLV